MALYTKPGGVDNWIGSSDCVCVACLERYRCEYPGGSSEKCRDYLKTFLTFLVNEWRIESLLTVVEC